MGNHDGKVVISTALDNGGLEKGIKGVAGKLGGLTKVVAAASAAMLTAITKQAVDAYADYEQLIGGVETMFKDSTGKVKQYAEDAFYTAGVSANEYMQTVTSFSASLISSLGGDTEKAADVANMALVDMADNANKMGTPLQSIQTAYQGFAKQQYMLLDNLKLGYGGTKTEMERLLKDAQKISGVKYDINNLADVYNAIHVIQNKLGIAGATAEEAEKTITGSANMTKAAWKNVLTAIAGGGDLDKAINNLVYSISKYFDNIVPVVERSIAGIGVLIERIAPKLVQSVATALIKAIPSLLSAVFQMVAGLVSGIYQGIVALFTGDSATTKLSAQLNNVQEAAGGAASAEQELAAGIGAASKAAQKAVAGFDELNVLQDKASSGSGGGGTGFDLSVSSSADVLDDENNQSNLSKSFGKFLEDANKRIDVVKKNFNEAFTADVPKLKKKWNELLGALKETFSDDNVQEAFSGFETETAEMAGKFAGSAASIATSFATGIVSGAADATNRLKEFNKVKLTSITKNLTTVADTAGNLAVSLADIMSAFEGEDFDGVVEFVAMLADLFVAETVDKITGAFSDFSKYCLQPIIKNSDKIKTILEKVLKITNLLIEPAKGLIDKISEEAKAYEDSLLHAFFEDLIEMKEKQVGEELDKIIKFLDGVIAFLTGEYTLEDWFNDNVAPWFTKEKWMELANEAKSGLERKWGEILAVLKNPLLLLPEQFRSVFKDAVNKAITVLNQFISQANKSLNFTIPGFTWKGQKQWGETKISLGKMPSIPLLAQGAVLPPNKPFMAVVGDQRHGTNVEAPLATIQEALANVLASKGSGDINIYFTGELAQLARVLKPVIEKEGKRVGTGMVRKAGT